MLSELIGLHVVVRQSYTSKTMKSIEGVDAEIIWRMDLLSKVIVISLVGYSELGGIEKRRKE